MRTWVQIRITYNVCGSETWSALLSSTGSSFMLNLSETCFLTAFPMDYKYKPVSRIRNSYWQLRIRIDPAGHRKNGSRLNLNAN